MHDVGKTALDHSILFKPGKLTEEEFEHVKRHPQLGYDFLNKDPRIDERTKDICLLHHERIDGTGYPYCLKGKEIPEMSKICSIVDVYEALTVKRCYHEAIEPILATEILTQEAGRKLDFDLVSKFLKNIAVYPTGSSVLLSNGEQAIVKGQNPSFPLRPVVRTVRMHNGKCIPKDEIDLLTKLNITIEIPQCATLRK